MKAACVSRQTNSGGPDRAIDTRPYLQQAVLGVLGCPWQCVGWFQGPWPLSAVCLRRTSLHTAEDQMYPDAIDRMPYITFHNAGTFVHSRLQNKTRTWSSGSISNNFANAITVYWLYNMLIKEMTNLILVFHRASCRTSMEAIITAAVKLWLSWLSLTTRTANATFLKDVLFWCIDLSRLQTNGSTVNNNL